jgi:hypothetical protein
LLPEPFAVGRVVGSVAQVRVVEVGHDCVSNGVHFLLVQVNLVGRFFEERQCSLRAVIDAEAQLVNAFPEGCVGSLACIFLKVGEVRTGFGAGEG